MNIRVFKLTTGAMCQLTRARHLLLPNYFVLSFPHREPDATEETELLARTLVCARELSLAIAEKQEAFTVIYSGHSTRRTMGWHAHIIVLANRRQKAWLYIVLAGKNLLQAIGVRPDVDSQPVIHPDLGEKSRSLVNSNVSRNEDT
jgi:hypothetical protein